MKKSVRFISIVMIIAMVFSMTCSAFAERGAALPEGATASNYTISGGTSSKGGGNTTVSANTRPSYYTNSRGEVVSSKELEVEGTAEAPKYLSDDDYYEALESADDVNIANNADFIMYIHDNLDDPTLIADGTIDTAYALFGTDVIEGTADLVADDDEEQAEDEEAEQVEQIVENMPPQFLGEEGEPAAEAPAEEQPAAEEQPEIQEEASVPAEEPAAPVEEVLTPVEEPAAPVEEPAATVEENAVPGELASAKKVIHAEAISYPGSTSTKFHTIHGYGSLISYLGKVEKVYMAETFDICNSTDYRITIDMGGTNVYAPSGEYAFYICKSGISGRSTITFTNGTITGNGFYVDDDGVLNLGGYYNTKVDILINGEYNALYVGNNGTAVIGQGAQLKCADGNTVEIEAGGQVRMSGGLVEATDPNGVGNNAVYNNGIFLLNSTGENVNYSYGVVRNLDGIAIYGDGDSQTTIGAGTVEGQTGIALDTDSKLTMYNGTVTGKGVKNDTWTDGNCGAAIAVNGYNAGPVATISGGALRSEKAAAIMDFDSGSRITQIQRDAITNITLFSDKIITEQKAGEISDYRVSKFTVNGIGYVTLGEAITAANLPANQPATIVMGGNYTMEAADAVPMNGDITFDGNGYRLDAVDNSLTYGLAVADGNVTIKNVEISGVKLTGTDGILINDGNVTIGPKVQIGVMEDGIHTKNGNVLVNDAFLKDSCKRGVYAEGGTTTISMVTDDAKTPVWATAASNLKITGGWFKYDVSQTSPANSKGFIKTYIDILQSHVKYVTDDKYYEVFFNDDPTVELISAEVVGTSDDVVYIAYDKSSATPIKFNFGAPVNQIDAISRNAGKTVYPIFSSPVGGTSGEVRIADQAVLMDLPAGIYDLKFTFANGAVITDKLVLYVYPKVVAAFKVPNTLEMSSLEADAVKKYISDDYRLSSYDVTDDYNIAVVMSEVDNLTKVSVGSNKAPFGDDVRDTNYIEYYLNGSPISADTFRLIPANSTDYGKYAGNYVFFISYADLNNLTPGQNYVFLDYADLADDQQIVTDKDLFAYNRFPFSVTNKSVSISPSSIQWTSLSGTAKFTVKPDVLDDYSVYIDGENVDKAYWTYDKDTNVLSIKGSYLGVLDKKEHTLEVLTSKGKVGASVNTKIGIMPKNLDYHVYGGAKALSFIASDKINKEGGVWIGSSNPTKLDPSCYTWDGENGFTLSAAFLNKLALGTYYVSAYVWNGEKYEYCTTSFKVISASQASYNPSTGDNSKIFIWLAVLALSAVAIVVILLPRFKKNKAVEGVADDAAGSAKHKK